MAGSAPPKGPATSHPSRASSTRTEAPSHPSSPSAFAPVELGTLLPGDDPLPASGTILAPGDTLYFRLETTAAAGTTVSLTKTGSDDVCPVLSPLDTTGGEQLVWQRAQCDSPAGDTASFSGLSDLGTERLFVVTDFYGLGGADYTFDLLVTAE